MIKLIIMDLNDTFLHSQGGYALDIFAKIRENIMSHRVHYATCTAKQCERVEELSGQFSKGIWSPAEQRPVRLYEGIKTRLD
ncbi:hypothetical protein [Klebsiella quasipneumoniae]|uniref:hypothetical protein n=1 Tax=Klebsiella quasipneumoniae TaxID=1463165 RepID=UPI0022DF9173|nr:hypothetical protein [Klebsiella quasipneumoniae]